MNCKLWLSNTTQAPEGYIGFYNVDSISEFILWNNHDSNPLTIEEIYLDHGICCIDFLKWLETFEKHYPIHVNEQNEVISHTAKEIISRNNWEVV